jgi:hypothetical protein
MRSVSTSIATTRDAVSRAASLLADHTEARAQLAVVLEQSLQLCAAGRDRRLSSPYPLLRRISGGSDVALVTLAISGASLCLACLAKKTGIPAAQVEAALTTIATTLRFAAAPGRCGSCHEARTIFRLDRDGSEPRTIGDGASPARSGTDRLWRYLAGIRGQMLCTRCLSLALGAVGRIDRAVMGVEGRGATRQYAPCSACGKERLVCGLV